MEIPCDGCGSDMDQEPLAARVDWVVDGAGLWCPACLAECGNVTKGPAYVDGNGVGIGGAGAGGGDPDVAFAPNHPGAAVVAASDARPHGEG